MAIGITMGDACGVGPEIVLMAWKKGEITDQEIIICDLNVIKYCNDKLGFRVPLRLVNELMVPVEGKLNLHDCKLLIAEDITEGQISEKCGQASLHYVKLATEWCLKGKLEAMVTLPINKQAVSLTTPGFSGHTGYIAELCKSQDYSMMLASNELIVTHVTTHVALKEAIESLTKDRIKTVIRLTNEATKKLRNSSRIAVAGLNPHAGESGQFGREDIDIIKPAIEEAKAEGIEASGPEAPDTIFFNTVRRKQYDAVVCMYHDQGHIPMKLLDFEGGVNVTLGLPIIRTSVDHGTAFDIAYEGKASTRSLDQALKMAKKLIGQ